jgi:hypothetical protein
MSPEIDLLNTYPVCGHEAAAHVAEPVASDRLRRVREAVACASLSAPPWLAIQIRSTLEK